MTHNTQSIFFLHGTDQGSAVQKEDFVARLPSLIKLNKRVRWSLFGCGITILIVLFAVPLLVKHQAIRWVTTHTSRTLAIAIYRTIGKTLD